MAGAAAEHVAEALAFHLVSGRRLDWARQERIASRQNPIRPRDDEAEREPERGGADHRPGQYGFDGEVQLAALATDTIGAEPPDRWIVL